MVAVMDSGVAARGLDRGQVCAKKNEPPAGVRLTPTNRLMEGTLTDVLGFTFNFGSIRETS